jgi:hypothetical protein
MRRPNFTYLSIASVALCSLASTGWASSQSNSNSSWDSSSNSNWSNNDSSSDGNSNSDNTYNPSRKASSRNEARIKQLENQNLSPFAPGTNNVSLEMGQVFLMGNFGSNYSDSIGEGLHYTYGVSDLFAFDSSMGYSTHSNGQMSMFNATAGLRTNLTWYDKIVPYFAFGLGFYRPSMTVTAGSFAHSFRCARRPGRRPCHYPQRLFRCFAHLSRSLRQHPNDRDGNPGGRERYVHDVFPARRLYVLSSTLS